MSKLSEFYAHKSSLIASGEMTPAHWDALEERLIKEDVLPELLQQLRAVLCQVKLSKISFATFSLTPRFNAPSI